jgi:YVTN family beta-propeller protein
VGSLSSNGTLAYLKQDRSSKVGVLDLQQDRAIEVSMAGSVAKKLGYATAAVAASVWIASLGSQFIPWLYPPPPDTSMLRDAQERYLYVINSQTDDITVLDAETLKREKLLRVSNPLFMAKQREGNGIWAFGQDEIALIDTEKNEIVMRRSEGVFAGAELASMRAYFADENGLNVIDTATGKVTAVVESLADAYLVVHALPSTFGGN